jgi:hypothetical protein
VIDAMFTPNPDWWKRTWIYCDQAIFAIHIEALLLALRRRHGTATGNTTFNALVDGTGPMPPGANPHYVGLDSVIEDEPLDVGFLMEDADDDPFFQNTTADVDDLEIGDHVIFWNSHVYRLISTGVWRLENAYVVDIQSKDDGKVSLDGLHLQGHGTPERAYPAYTEEIAGHLREAIGDALTKIKDAVKANPAVTQIVGAPSLIRWSPYESFGEASLPVRTIRGVEKVVLPEKGERGALKTLTLGAWWVRVPFAEWGSAKKAVMAIPKAIGVDATGIVVSGEPTSENPVPAMQTIAKATGFTTPTDAANSVYFPLLEPRVVSRIGEFPWAAYLRRREADSTFPPAGLDAVVVDGTLMPGLFPRGRNKPQITLVRPKAGP